MSNFAKSRVSITIGPCQASIWQNLSMARETESIRRKERGYGRKIRSNGNIPWDEES